MVRYLSKSSVEFQCFEMQAKVGGMWNYTPENDASMKGLNNDPFFCDTGTCFHSLYEYLETNIPAYLMQAKDFVTRTDGGYFSLKETQDFLAKYTEHFGLLKHVRLNTYVKDVRLATPEE